MAEEEYGVRPEDVRVDEQGRIIVTNPQVAERLRAVAAKPKNGTVPNGNCNGCSPINNVPNCGCQLSQ
jgi:hypothetical protein